GRDLAALPLHPRLGHMLMRGGPQAAPLAALLAERDPLPRAAPVDLKLRLEAVDNPARFARGHRWEASRGVLDRIRSEAARLRRAAKGAEGGLSPAEQAALAYPDRIAHRRKGDAPRYLLSGGKGAMLDAADPLAGAPFLVVTDTDGDPREARIRQAAQITEGEIRALFAEDIRREEVCRWSRREGRVIARRQERLGAILLDDRLWRDVPADRVARAMLDGVRELGLSLTDAARRFLARVALVRATEPDLPDLSEPALMETLEDWLLPFLAGVRSTADWKRFDPLPALRAILDWDQQQRLDRAAPPAFTSPLGRQIPIDYSGDPPEIALRLQEMFGQTTHPTVGRTPLKVTLLSPAGRPVQVTTDLPGFWASSYADVRKDMRGRYPKHPWPEDPTKADPTLRAKPRK
ncbi:ATP-dependent helicase HrpB, partial [Aquicoccus sp. SCR17]|nr:ATP-dependent helicase HrpB [Carideicomes alvinocaridis]